MKRCANEWLLLVFVLVAPHAKAQQPRSANQVELGQNFPNPFNPATTIPFRLNADLWANGQRPTVSLRIYNVLAQLVAIPTLQGPGQPVDNLTLDCPSPNNGYCDFSAYWDGFYQNSTHEAA